MSIFSEKAIAIINDYRQLLKKFMTRTERVQKLLELRLNRRSPDEPDMDLYKTIQSILEDVRARLQSGPAGYYSYSGLYSFYDHVQASMQDYALTRGHIVHRTQAASRALLEAFQMLSSASSSKNPQDALVFNRFQECNSTLAHFASDEQLISYRERLEQRLYQNEPFFSKVIDDLQHKLEAPVEL